MIYNNFIVQLSTSQTLRRRADDPQSRDSASFFGQRELINKWQMGYFIEKAKKYTDLTELTLELLRMFISKVVVGEKAEKYSCTAPQDIWIRYRDNGMLNDVKEEFDIPSTEWMMNCQLQFKA